MAGESKFLGFPCANLLVGRHSSYTPASADQGRRGFWPWRSDPRMVSPRLL